MIKFSPIAKTALFYFLIGIMWIYGTDYLLNHAIGSLGPDIMTMAQQLKGFLFVVVSTVVLYGLLKKYRQQQQRLETAYVRIFKESPQPMWIYDSETYNFLQVNDAAVNHYGFSREEFLRMDIMDIRPAEDREALLKVIRENQHKVRAYSVWRHLKKDGSLIYVKVMSSETSYKGRDAVVVSIWDITEKYLADEALKQQQDLLDTIINSTEDLIWAVDKEHRLLAYNNAYAEAVRRLVGVEVVIGKEFPDVEPEETARWDGFYAKSLAGEKQVIEISREMKGGGMKYFEATFDPILHDGKITGVACFARDITKRKETEISLKEINTSLFEVARISSHDLRSPVAALLGVVRLFDRDLPANPENVRLIGLVEKLSEDMDSTLHMVAEKCNAIFMGQQLAHQERSAL